MFSWVENTLLIYESIKTGLFEKNKMTGTESSILHYFRCNF